MPLNRWLDKHIMVYTYNEIQLNIKKNELLIRTTWMNLSYAEWKDPDKKEHYVNLFNIKL